MKPGSRTPFKRILMLVAGLQAAAAQMHAVVKSDIPKERDDARTAYDDAAAALRGYKSRGKGGHHRTTNRQIGGRWSQDRSCYMLHQGKREMARRVRQGVAA